MSILRLKEIKNNKRYDSSLAFVLTGVDLKILVDAIIEYNPSADLDILKFKKGYNSTIGIPLSGEEVRKLLDAIACPSDDLRVIKNQLRYDTSHEYILTGFHVRLIIESLEDDSCLISPNRIYQVYLGVFSVGDLTIDGFVNSLSNASGQFQFVFLTAGYANCGEIAYALAGNYPTTIWLECPEGEQPTDWLWNPDSSGDVPLVFTDYGLSDYKCYETTIDLTSLAPNTVSDSAELYITSALGNLITNGGPALEIPFDDVNFPDTLTSYVKLGLGQNSTAIAVLEDPTTITITIQNCPIELSNIVSTTLPAAGQVTSNFAVISCS